MSDKKETNNESIWMDEQSAELQSYAKTQNLNINHIIDPRMPLTGIPMLVQ